MEKINKISTYLESMSKSLYDKIWWIDKIDNSIDTIVDFGCADASIMILINKMFPNHFNYIGIDNNPDMLKLAQDNLLKANCSFKLYNTIFELDKSINYSNSILIMNSVIHEIFYYENVNDIIKIFTTIFEDFNFKHIAIRDMFYDYTMKLVSKERYNKILSIAPDQLKNFEEIRHCSAQVDKHFVEFLLKYRYIENWNREVKEMYLWNWIWYIDKINSYDKKYEKIFEDKYSLPYIVRLIKKDFHINLKEKTHAKVLYDRIGE